jgi:hypothetical protein
MRFRLFMLAILAWFAIVSVRAHAAEPVEGSVMFVCQNKIRRLEVFPVQGVPSFLGQEDFVRDHVYRLYGEPIAGRHDGALRVCHIFDFISDRALTMHSIARWESDATDVRCARAKNETLEVRLNGKPVARFDAGCEASEPYFRLVYSGDTLTICRSIRGHKIKWSPDCDGGRQDKWLIAPKLRSVPR